MPTDPAVLVAGEALVDLIARAGEPLTAVPGGSPFNTTRAIARLGVACGWIGGLSDDRFGRTLEAALRADGVDLGLVQRTSLPTTLALAELDASGAATYGFYIDGTSAPALRPEPLRDGLPAGTRALLTGSLGLVLEPMASTIEGVVATLPADVILMLDPNARPSIIQDVPGWRTRLERLLPRVDIVKASVEDLALLRPGATAAAAARWIRALGPAAVVVTDGPGPVLVDAGDRQRSLDPEPVDVVDSIGAGDTFAGALLAFLVASGTSREDLADPERLSDAATFALRASAEVCRRVGADPPTLEALGGWQPAS